MVKGIIKRIRPSDAWLEVKELLIVHRSGLVLGVFLMLVSRLCGLVLPASSQYVIDDDVVNGRHGLLLPIVFSSESLL